MMIKIKKIAIATFLSSIFIWPWASFSNPLAYSKDYYLGYVKAITDEVLPEKKVKIELHGRDLEIRVLGEPLDVDTQEILLNRLKGNNFFAKVSLSSKKQLDAKDNIGTPREDLPTIYEVLPTGTIYSSPIADPKWPRFSMGYQRHFKNNFGKDIFSLSFGENLALIRWRNQDSTYELGIQAALIGLMDISTKITRLINSDYFVGIGMSMVHLQNWQNLIQLSHLSSHLGDELLISKPTLAKKRINLSYETLKWFTAYNFIPFRPYAAIGYMVHREPSYIKPLSFEVGCDYKSESKFLFENTQYVFGIHGYFWQQNKYNPVLNIRTGLQLKNPIWRGRLLQFLVEYSNGYSRHGQFYSKKENYIGVLVALAT